MKQIYKVYRNLLGVVATEAPIMFVFTILASVGYGLLQPISVYVNSMTFNLGLAIAREEYLWNDYLLWLVAFVATNVAPILIRDIYINTYVEMRAVLIYRTAFRKQMFEKMKNMKYQHYESEESAEIIDRAFTSTDNAARHLFPMFFFNWVVGIVGSFSSLIYLFSVQWWLVLTTLVPYIIETCLMTDQRFKLFDEMDAYWKKDRSYFVLGEYLRSREYAQEQKLFGSAGHLTNLYRERLHARNREYESFFFRYLKLNISGNSVTKIAKFANAALLLMLYVQGQIDIGQLIAFTTLVLGSLYGLFDHCITPIKGAGRHMRNMQFLEKLLDLSEETDGAIDDLPSDYTIEFQDVWFRYPGSERDILQGVSFVIPQGQRISLVGKNGEGKTTIVKLLLGLFRPDKGQILINGQDLYAFSREARVQMFGPVMQDFVRYQLTLHENIGVGNIAYLEDDQRVHSAATKAKVDDFSGRLPAGYRTLLGREFASGIDLSGGQWQRIAIARAFMGDKPILLLDEPTSQLDPIAETMVYTEFAEMAQNKTAIFITHRLASTQITERILVLNEGRICEEGSHEALMDLGGIYADMFTTQKQYYENQQDSTHMNGGEAE